LGDDSIDLEAIRLTAYFLWEQQGRPEGRAADLWHQACGMHRRAQKNGRQLDAGLNAQLLTKSAKLEGATDDLPK
jgi:hypothetical protein